MRRTTAILTVCLCVVAGCRGGAAQGPYDGVLATQSPVKAAAILAPPVPEAEPIASEVDVPWAIALLSDAETPTVRKHGSVIVVDTDRDVPGTLAQEADLQVGVDGEPAEVKPAAPNACSGVVNRRS